MTAFFSSGRAVDVALVFMAIELLALALLWTLGRSTLRPLDVVANVGAGAALLLALRSALRGPQWRPVALWLLVALGFHVWDLSLRRGPRRVR